MAKKKAPKHGGAREGAGRKPANPEGKTVVVAATIPGDLVDQLDSLREKRGWNRSQAITEAVRGLVAKQ